MRHILHVPTSPIDLPVHCAHRPAGTLSLESVSSSLKQKIISSMPRAKAPASLEDSDKEGEDLHRNNIIFLHRIGNDEEDAVSIGAAAAASDGSFGGEGGAALTKEKNAATSVYSLL